MFLDKFRGKAKRKKIDFARNPLNFEDLGELDSDGRLTIKLTNSVFKYVGDTSDMEQKIPNIDKCIALLNSLIVLDLEEKVYMVIKAPKNKPNNTGCNNVVYTVLNSMTEFIFFKRFIGKDIAISVNINALRGIAEKQAQQIEKSN